MVSKSNPVVSDTDSVDKDEGMTSKSSASTRSTSSRRSRTSRRPSSSQHLHHHHVKHYVEHDYHDHKHDPVEAPMATLALTAAAVDEGATRRSGHKGGVSTPFPEKLHELLETVDQQGDSDICGWQPHGRCFIVHKPKEFVSKVMPQ